MLSDLLPETLGALGLASDVAERLAVFFIGFGVFVHLICTANFMPAKKTPADLWLPVALGVSCAAIMMHGAIYGNISQSLWAGAILCATLVIFQVALWVRGYHVCDHIEGSEHCQ